MERTFYVTCKKQNQYFPEGKCFPVLAVLPVDLGNVVKLLVAGEDGHITFLKTSDVAFTGFEQKEGEEYSDVIEQPPTLKKPTKGVK